MIKEPRKKCLKCKEKIFKIYGDKVVCRKNHIYGPVSIVEISGQELK